MVTPANIINVVSDQFGVHRATVSMHDRMLVTSGHRKITGRGNAARGSPDSAAALLLAVAATPLSGAAIKETAIHYERYARLLATCHGGGWDSWQVKHLDQLAPGHSLHEAIAAVIVALGAGIAQACDLFEEAVPDTDDILTDLAIDVELDAPTPSAAIFIRAEQWRYHLMGELPAGGDLTIEQRAIFQDERVAQFESRVEYRQTFEDTTEYLDTLPLHPIVGRRSPDLKQKRVFTIATLAHVAALFSDRVKL
ncbi:hypothetical protein [Nitrobacter sp. TKz-YC01]|uniref:hypothetical protein n=1 Tax=Nitrobacter sp. TKz-YC01 TaxID=3398703 RepID=UPI003A100117